MVFRLTGRGGTAMDGLVVLSTNKFGRDGSDTRTTWIYAIKGAHSSARHYRMAASSIYKCLVPRPETQIDVQ
jgi:hypothetical protein